MYDGEPETEDFLNSYQYYNSSYAYQMQTDYVDNVELSSNDDQAVDVTMISQAYNNEGYIQNPSSPVYYYYRRDHLGSNREVWCGNTNITVQKTQYYPSGLPMASISSDNTGQQNRKFAGKEFIEMHGYDMLDLGARLYDFVNFPTVDPLAEKYPNVSPYVYCLNNPVNHVDLDGRVVIFINGMHNGFEGGKREYWNGLDNRVMNRIGDHQARYYDGAMGGPINTQSFSGSNLSARTRIKLGEKMGFSQADGIISNLKDGETVKIATHSMGGAYGKGFIKGMQKYAKENNIDLKGKIEFEVDLAPFQPGSQKAVNGVPTITISHNGDIVAGSDPVDGAKNKVTRQDQKPGFSEHSVDSFTQQEIDRFVPRNPSTGDAANNNKKQPK